MMDTDRIRQIFDEFGAASVIDIVLIAVAVFGVFRILSGTRAMTQVRGALVAIAIAVILGRIFDLTAVNYLIDRAAGIAVIAAVVVFQPELRRALDRMGRAGLAHRAQEAEAETLIRAVAGAAAAMSRHRHGGLVVIERETGLQDIIESGTRMDAMASSELIESIFFPNSPLHDMAVVAREDRVVAAGCILPLSDATTSQGRALGTRHRAAVGVTETTDAVCVVVSEETGEISLALAGRLTPVVDAHRLEALLQWLLVPAEPGQPAAPVRSAG